jgi:hypothetical protein
MMKKLATGKFLKQHRAIILGLLLVQANLMLLMHMEVGTKNYTGAGAGPFPSTISLFGNCILLLLMITAINSSLARRSTQLALKPHELVIIYVMLVTSTAIVSIDFLDILVPMIAHPFRFATPENQWAEKILPYMPSWVCVHDIEALKGWYEGHSSLYHLGNIQPWLLPVAVWSGVILTMLAVMFCINTLVRRQWMQNEKLLFPIVEVPMQIINPEHRLLKSKLTWTGFAVAGGITLLNGLHFFYPNLPSIPVKIRDIAPYVTIQPWNAIGTTPISFYPYAIGLGFLLPLDMLFSCWFFFVSWRLVRVIGAIYGVYDTTPNFPFMNQQALGGYYLIALFAIWSARKHLSAVIRSALNGSNDNLDEPISYRTAIIGLVLGTTILIWFFHLLGLRWWISVVAIVLYFFLATGISRMHAEFGPPAHDLHYMGPEIVLINAFGPRFFGSSELCALSWFWWFNRAYRSIPIAYQLDGLKLGQRSGVHSRYIAIAMALASVSSVIGGFWIYLHFGYTRGASVNMAGHVPWFGVEAFSHRLERWINGTVKQDIPSTIAIGWGVIFTYFLYIMKLRLSWWPLHPLGFAISTSYSIGTLWMPLFIAWVVKSLTTKYGGLRLYRILLDFFIGLVLGDFVVGCLWPVVGWILGVSTYSFMQ